ncbi:carbonic anhydrase 2-like protein [Tanacetum coccineum]
MARNIGNFVPLYNQLRYSGVGAIIEYAITTLKVEVIVVIGHSRCGGIERLLSLPDTETSYDFLDDWVSIGQPAKEKVLAERPDASGEELQMLVEKESVMNSLMNLISYPYVRSGVADKTLKLMGGYYNFVDGKFQIMELLTPEGLLPYLPLEETAAPYLLRRHYSLVIASGPEVAFVTPTIPGLGLETLISTDDIPLDLRPRMPDPNFRMINLPTGDTDIGIYSRIFDSSGVRIPFSSIHLEVIKHFKVRISQLVPLDRRAIPFHMPWRHPDSCVTDGVPTDFNQDHVDWPKAHIVKLRDIPEGVLVRSGVSRVWCNPMCDPVLRRSDNTVMSIYDFLCMSSLDKVTVREEPHGLDTSILDRVANHTTSPAPAGTAIPRATPKEIVVT